MKTIDVIIFCGQSNMQGQSECLSEEKIVHDAYEYKYLTDEIVSLKNPVGENIKYDNTEGFTGGFGEIWRSEHIAGAAWEGCTNLVPEFCRTYIEKTGREVLAVHVAKGHTEIAYWSSGNDGYDILCRKTKAALKKLGKNYDVNDIFFVWLQGESDAIAASSKEYYKEKLIALNEALKKDFNIAKFGIIRVGKFVEDERDDEIINAQSEICTENEDFIMLTEIATELNKRSDAMNPGIKGHYSAKGLEILGRESGASLGKYATVHK